MFNHPYQDKNSRIVTTQNQNISLTHTLGIPELSDNQIVKNKNIYALRNKSNNSFAENNVK